MERSVKFLCVSAFLTLCAWMLIALYGGHLLTAAEPPTPLPAEKVFDGSVRRALLKKIVTSRVEHRLTREGFKSIGGPDKPLTEAEVTKLLQKLDDPLFDQAVRESSPKTWAAVGEGGFLARIVQWIKDHPEEVAAIIKLIMTLLMAFADNSIPPPM